LQSVRVQEPLNSSTAAQLATLVSPQEAADWWWLLAWSA
jgi:hypothetical protein